ncbi:hypothetical protein CCP4SC76_3180002 [Gammaproteobacteria bacterium]
MTFGASQVAFLLLCGVWFAGKLPLLLWPVLSHYSAWFLQFL